MSWDELQKKYKKYKKIGTFLSIILAIYLIFSIFNTENILYFLNEKIFFIDDNNYQYFKYVDILFIGIILCIISCILTPKCPKCKKRLPRDSGWSWVGNIVDKDKKCPFCGYNFK